MKATGTARGGQTDLEALKASFASAAQNLNPHAAKRAGNAIFRLLGRDSGGLNGLPQLCYETIGKAGPLVFGPREQGEYAKYLLTSLAILGIAKKARAKIGGIDRQLFLTPIFIALGGKNKKREYGFDLANEEFAAALGKMLSFAARMMRQLRKMEYSEEKPEIAKTAFDRASMIVGEKYPSNPNELAELILLSECTLTQINAIASEKTSIGT